jgi:hypothetical protein
MPPELHDRVINRLEVPLQKRRDRSVAAQRAWRTRRAMSAFAKARASEAASKEALRLYGEQHGWKVAFFEGATGAPRTGIIDAIAYRLGRGNADLLDVRLVQLKRRESGRQRFGDCTAEESERRSDGELAHRRFRRRDVASAAGRFGGTQTNAENAAGRESMR